MGRIREQIFNEMLDGLSESDSINKDLAKATLKTIFVEPENPKNYRYEGETTFKTIIDKLYGPNIDFDEIEKSYDFVEQNTQLELTSPQIENFYNKNIPMKFWVRDRYGDGSQIIYTFFDDKMLFEIFVNEMVDL